MMPNKQKLDDLVRLGNQDAGDTLARNAAEAIVALLDLVAENTCGSCVGTGKPISGLPCMCGGTGKASDAVPYLLGQLEQYRKYAERYSWCRLHPTFMGWDSDYQAEFIDKDVDTEMEKEKEKERLRQ